MALFTFHPIYVADRYWTHDLSVVSPLSLPQDYGSSPQTASFRCIATYLSFTRPVFFLQLLTDLFFLAAVHRPVLSRRWTALPGATALPTPWPTRTRPSSTRSTQTKYIRIMFWSIVIWSVCICRHSKIVNIYYLISRIFTLNFRKYLLMICVLQQNWWRPVTKL